MHKQTTRFASLALAPALLVLPCIASPSEDEPSNACNGLPSYSALQSALAAAVNADTTGLKLQMWATVVNRDGVVCAVAFTGVNRGAQWPGSRVISAQKANTANSFSLDGSSVHNSRGLALALSTANLFSAVQPGGSLFGLQESNPVDTRVAYRGPSSQYGTANDPMVANKIGGVNVFGGGLALYAAGDKIVGAVGVSGDTSCRDHNVAWIVRHNLGMDHLGSILGPAGLFASDPTHPDNIIFDITPNPSGGTGKSATGFGHAVCSPPSPASGPTATPTASGLPAVAP